MLRHAEFRGIAFDALTGGRKKKKKGKGAVCSTSGPKWGGGRANAQTYDTVGCATAIETGASWIVK